MPKYPKPPGSKTVDRGLRPRSTGSQDSFPPSLVEKMRKLIERTLVDSQPLTTEEDWLLGHVLLVAQFRRTSFAERDQILRRINKHEEEGRRYGFDTEEIRGLNRVVLQIDQAGRLEDFLQKVEKRKE